MIFKLVVYYFSLLYWSHQSAEKVRSMQLKRFKKMFEYARLHSDFYRNVYEKAGVMDLDIQSWEDVEKIPFVDKEMMRGYTLQELTTCDTNGKDVVQCTTSGSTGEPFKLAYSKFANLAAYLRVFFIMRQTFGYGPFCRMAILSKYEVTETFKVEKNLSLLTQIQRRFGVFDRKIISIFEKPNDVVCQLQEYNPQVLYSSSSAVEIIANYIKEKNIEIHIPNIVLIAEPVSQKQYALFASVFGAKVVDIYGAKESPSLGYEVNKEGVYHVFPNSNIFEFVDVKGTESGTKGTIVVTNLINDVQPFVRYNLKDYADWVEDSEFGIKWIGPIVGRLSDILTFPDGNKLFHYCISQLFIDFAEAKQYKFLQIGDGPIEMYIRPSTGYSEREIINGALERWNKKYSNYDLRITIVDHFDIDDKTGKFKVIEHMNA